MSLSSGQSGKSKSSNAPQIKAADIKHRSDLKCPILDVYLTEPVTFHNPETEGKELHIISKQAADSMMQVREGEIAALQRRKDNGEEVTVAAHVSCPFCRHTETQYYEAKQTKIVIYDYAQRRGITIKQDSAEKQQSAERENQLRSVKEFFANTLNLRAKDDARMFLPSILYWFDKTVGKYLRSNNRIFQYSPLPGVDGQSPQFEKVESDSHPFRLLARVGLDLVETTNYTMDEVIELLKADANNKTTQFADLMWEHFVKRVVKAYSLHKKESELSFKRYFEGPRGSVAKHPHVIESYYNLAVQAGIISHKYNYFERFQQEINCYKNEVNREIGLTDRLAPNTDQLNAYYYALLGMGLHLTNQSNDGVPVPYVTHITNSLLQLVAQQPSQVRVTVQYSRLQPSDLTEDEALELAVQQSQGIRY